MVSRAADDGKVGKLMTDTDRPGDVARVSFGLKTSPMHTTYQQVVRTWQQADEVAEIEHAWLWDHMLPLSGPKDGPIFEGWTLLTALAAQTQRLRFGLLVTNNQIRQPAVLGKIASTLDVIAGGRLILGIGAGGTLPADTPRSLDQHPGLAEYLAYGLPVTTPADGLAKLAESIAIVRQMFTEDSFDFDGHYYSLTGTRNEPKSVQPGGPPILIGGSGPRMLRLVAEHADIWNVPGPPHATVEFLAERSRVLDQECEAIGRDPATLIRSTQVMFTGDDLQAARALVGDVIAAGFRHVVMAVRPPAPDNIARWLADEIIAPALDAR
jgi:alkanesulfonate monooxygenase SsuD/methylene tetrahydromethanopterin reductase-like flavin-dependent oxidoreductase (luciferase family)